MKNCIINILFCFLLIQAKAADNYALNDTLYVWARNGLNLREQPDLKGKVLRTLESGARVVVREITEKKLTLNSGVDTTRVINDPYLLRGRWILIETDSGQKGYLFDVYLLKYPAPNESVYSIEGYMLKVMKEYLSIDTIWNPEGIQRYESDNEFYKVKFTTSKGIRFFSTFGSAGALSVSEIDGFSIEEGFVFFMYLYPGLSNEQIKDYSFLLQNWTNELVISIGICTIRFCLKGQNLFIEETCSC